MSALRPPCPAPANDWACALVDLLCDSHARLTGRALGTAGELGVARARALFTADFALLAHGTEDDPLFCYLNQTALRLFELDWDTAVRLPSRASAEVVNQDARAALMRRVRETGYIDDYAGVRISASGRRFRIERATVWNVIDAAGVLRGQAAMFAHWTDLDSAP